MLRHRWYAYEQTVVMLLQAVFSNKQISRFFVGNISDLPQGRDSLASAMGNEIVAVAPPSRARVRRSGSGSTTMIDTAPAALAHRIIVKTSSSIHDVQPGQIVRELLETVPIGPGAYAAPAHAASLREVAPLRADES